MYFKEMKLLKYAVISSILIASAFQAKELYYLAEMESIASACEAKNSTQCDANELKECYLLCSISCHNFLALYPTQTNFDEDLSRSRLNEYIFSIVEYLEYDIFRPPIS